MQIFHFMEDTMGVCMSGSTFTSPPPPKLGLRMEGKKETRREGEESICKIKKAGPHQIVLGSRKHVEGRSNW